MEEDSTMYDIITPESVASIDNEEVLEGEDCNVDYIFSISTKQRVGIKRTVIDLQFFVHTARGSDSASSRVYVQTIKRC